MHMKKISILLMAGVVAFIVSGCGPSKGVNKQAGKTDYSQRRMILRDEALSQLSYVDIAHPQNNWHVPVPAGRDLQLVGKGRVLIGTGTGYEERDIATGKKVNELTSFNGTISARKLKNGNILLAGLN